MTALFKQNCDLLSSVAELNQAQPNGLTQSNRAFSHDVTAAILVFQNNETAAMLVYQTNLWELNSFLM